MESETRMHQTPVGLYQKEDYSCPLFKFWTSVAKLDDINTKTLNFEVKQSQAAEVFS